MNILITGSTGFIGKSCYYYFKNTDNNIYAPTHQELDLLNLFEVQKFINNNNIECVINSANIIARKYSPLTKEKIYDCLLMFENILYASKDCKFFIHFGSGAELGRYLIDDINYAKEEDLNNIVTNECGGFTKSLMSKRLLSYKNLNYYNLRIAGCFGKYELKDRFIMSNLIRAINNKPLLIHQNRYMDFIYIEDLIKIIIYILKNNVKYKDINCVYTQKYTLLDILKIIQKITNTNSPIQIENEKIGTSYVLDNTRLQSLNIDLIGLTAGIEKMYKEIKCL
jgi:nucleoside-diphosphate-sugar epimerase